MVVYEQENNKVYMVVDGENSHAVPDFDMRMLEKNSIDALLGITIRHVNNRRKLYYDITSKKQLSRLYDFNKMSRANVENILSGIDEMINSVNEYMLELDSVVLDPEFIYVELSTGKLFFAYGFDGESKGFKAGIRRLFDFIIEHFDHTSCESDVIHIYNIYQRIIQGDYDCGSLKALLKNDDVKGVAEAAGAEASKVYDDREDVIGTGDMELGFIPKEELVCDDEKVNGVLFWVIRVTQILCGAVIVATLTELLAPRIIPLDIDNRIVFAMMLVAAVIIAVLAKLPKELYTVTTQEEVMQPFIYDEPDRMMLKDNNIKQQEDRRLEMVEPEHTMLLSEFIKKNSAGSGVRLRSLEEDKKQDVDIISFPWMLGSDSKHCNTVITGKAVSHIHACIYKEEGEYYIEDMNSTNGTYVNNDRLIMNSRQMIHNGDMLTLAAASYSVEIS